MNVGRLLFGGGVAALALSVLVGSPLPPNVGLRLTQELAVVLTGGTALLVGWFGLTVLLASDGTPERPTSRATGRSTADAPRLAGWKLDDAIESLGADTSSHPPHWGLVGPHAHLQSELRTLAVEALVDSGHDRGTAQRLVETGEWTDDPRAAAFLGDEAPPVPLRARIQDWATGEGERARAERAVEAVADLAEVDR